MRLGQRSAVGWLIGACVAGAAVGQTPPPAVKPAAGGGAATTGAGAAKAKASLEPLLQQATDALAAGQYQPAREAFLDAVALDAKNVKAHHGLAMCLVAQKEVAKAAAMFDKALTLTTTPDRALVLNAAAAHMATRAHMRAAKLAKDYLTAHPKELDEPVLNALGTALSEATNAERKNRFFTDCASFYVIANQRLEAARPGYKRFGSDWYPAKEADAKTAALGAKQKQLDALSEAIDTAWERLESATKELDRQKYLLTRGEPPGNYYIRQAEYNYDNAKANMQTAEERYDTLANSLERPKFPPEIRMVAMDAVTAPPLAEGATLASAEPTPAVVKPKPIRVSKVKPADPKATTTAPPPEPPMALEPPKPTAPRKVRITQYAAAFPVAADLVVTSAALVNSSSALQLQSADGQSMTAELVREDEKTGLALLRVTGGRKLNALALADAFAGGPVSCASFPTVDVFSPAAQAITGVAPAPKDGWLISLSVHPRLAGAPVIANGRVVGVCVAPRDAERGKLPAVTLEQLKAFLGADVTAPAKAGDPAGSLLQLVTTRESGGE